MNIFQKVFKCNKCKGFFGCQCGNFGDSKQKAGEGIAQAGRMSEAERAGEQRSLQLDQLIDQILQGQAGTGQMPAGFRTGEQQFGAQGPISQALSSEVLRGVQDPSAVFQSTLQPQLQAAEDFINRRAQERGLLRSGVPIEQMGRAGVELAISEAMNRLNFRNQAIAQGMNISGVGSELQQQNLANLAALSGRGQEFGQAARGRQAQYEAYPLQAQLGSAYGKEAAIAALPGQLIGAGGQIAASIFAPKTFGILPGQKQEVE